MGRPARVRAQQSRLGRLGGVSPGRHISEARKKRLVLVAVGLLRRGDPTPFAYETMLIHAIRAALLLEGKWTWKDANRASRDVVHEALRQLKAKRPTYREASTPHYAQADAFSLYERTRCRNCGLRLPPENRVFCSDRCNGSFHGALRRAEEAAFRAMLAEGL